LGWSWLEVGGEEFAELEEGAGFELAELAAGDAEFAGQPVGGDLAGGRDLAAELTRQEEGGTAAEGVEVGIWCGGGHAAGCLRVSSGLEVAAQGGTDHLGAVAVLQLDLTVQDLGDFQRHPSTHEYGGSLLERASVVGLARLVRHCGEVFKRV
jgi:hypothetical protein